MRALPRIAIGPRRALFAREPAARAAGACRLPPRAGRRRLGRARVRPAPADAGSPGAEDLAAEPRAAACAHYEQGRPDALAILLGAESLGDAITNLERQSALAGQDKHMFLEARAAHRSLVRLRTSLATREDRLAALEQQASAAAADLEAARSERQGYLADLQNRRQLNESTASRRSSSRRRRRRSAHTRSPPSTRSRRSAGAGRARTHGPCSACQGSRPCADGGRHRVRASRDDCDRSSGRPRHRCRRPDRDPVRNAHDDPRVRRRRGRRHGLGDRRRTRIDVWVPTESQANQWGVKTITIYLQSGHFPA